MFILGRVLYMHTGFMLEHKTLSSRVKNFHHIVPHRLFFHFHKMSIHNIMLIHFHTLVITGSYPVLHRSLHNHSIHHHRRYHHHHMVMFADKDVSLDLHKYYLLDSNSSQQDKVSYMHIYFLAAHRILS